MNTCVLPPDSSAYAGTQSSPVIETQLAGGLPRLRVDQIGTVGNVDVKWVCNPASYKYLQAFYRTMKYGSLPFQIGLILDSETVDIYTVTIKPGSWALASQTGLTYVQTASLYVVPNPVDISSDLIIMLTFGLTLLTLSGLLLTDTVTSAQYEITVASGTLTPTLSSSGTAVVGLYLLDQTTKQYYSLTLISGAFTLTPVSGVVPIITGLVFIDTASGQSYLMTVVDGSLSLLLIPV